MNPQGRDRVTSRPLVEPLHLWYLGNPQQPVLVGELKLVMSGRGVSLRYHPAWLRAGFALSEDLPLIDIEHFPREKDSAAGAIDDARPDRWGERVIRALDRPARLSVLEYLYHAGDDRFGALGVSISGDEYLPRDGGPLPRLADVDAVYAVVRKVLAGEAVGEQFRRLIAPGTTMGGARPKGLVQINGSEWILKFAEEGHLAEPLIEHACMTLAAKAGINVATTRAIRLINGHAIVIRRFDRYGNGLRRHALSAKVALEAAGLEMSYPNLAQLLRRTGDVEGRAHMHQMHELFRRLIFNILIDNTDDHEKNHVLLMSDAGHYELAPAFDVLPICQSLGYQSMVVGTRGSESSIDNALSAAQDYWLSPTAAVAQARQVALVVEGWAKHFAARKLSPGQIDQLAAHIDRAGLLEQRRSLLG